MNERSKQVGIEGDKIFRIREGPADFFFFFFESEFVFRGACDVAQGQSSVLLMGGRVCKWLRGLLRCEKKKTLCPIPVPTLPALYCRRGDVSLCEDPNPSRKGAEYIG